MKLNRFKKFFYKMFSDIKILPFVESIRLINNINKTYGYLRSVNKFESVDYNNDPIPWFTYPAIELLNSLDISNASVFEWGSGYSSLYWAKRCKDVFSIEDNEEWFNKISMKVKYKKIKNLKIFLKKDTKSYVESISYPPFVKRLFDIIVIDGLDRLGCAKKSISKLKNNGILILDNAELWPDVVKCLNNSKYFEIPFIGSGPINSYLWKTSFFRKKTLGDE